MITPTTYIKVITKARNRDNDGEGIWSTFILNIGTPPQPSRVLISTTSSETWVVGPEGCPQEYGSNCKENRGLLFNPDKSTSWTANRNFSLFLEENLGYEGTVNTLLISADQGCPNLGFIELIQLT